MLTLKFGGTSVGNADAIAQTVSVIAQTKAQDHHIAVVTSAMSGVTDMLVDAAGAAAAGQRQPYLDAREALYEKHLTAARQLLQSEEDLAVYEQHITTQLGFFSRLCASINVLGELTPRGLDVVSGLGERMSAPLLAAALRARGVQAAWIDATEIVVTDDNFGEATPLLAPTCSRVQNRLLPMFEEDVTPVITGFVGATESGIPTTLGRGGSDFTAAIIGSCLPADEIQIWTDVNGILTADPRIVPQARTLRQLSYNEAAELAYFGAIVIHPKTMLPAVERNIPIRILNTFDPRGPSTVITQDPTKNGLVKAISAIRELTMMNVEGRGMMGVPGIAARTFRAVADVRANVLMISQASSEQSICFVVKRSRSDDVKQALEIEFERELARHYIDQVRPLHDVVILAVVGSGMRGTPGISGRLFNALGEAGVNVIALAQGSSESNISLVVARDDLEIAVRAIHQAFFQNQDLSTPQLA
jgi:aspartate kinase